MGTKNQKGTLYKYKNPIEKGKLKVSEIHQIYWEISGNKNGPPVLFIHGGPGFYSIPENRGYFDPDYYKIILFDQRGCGKSEPFGCMKENTTWDLVSDIETLREFLKIQKWHIIFGESWGTTLALCYSEKHSDKLSNIILRGVTLGRDKETDFMYKDGNSWFFPEQFEILKNILPENERDNILYNCWKQFHGDNEEIKKKLLIERINYHTNLIFLTDKFNQTEISEEDYKKDILMAIYKTSYYVDKFYLERDNQLLEDAYKIKDIPMTIIHGRLDMRSPILSAFDLHKKLPNSIIDVIPNGGNSIEDRETKDAIVRATDKYIIRKIKI